MDGEAIARIVYNAMCWGWENSEAGSPPDWVAGGNSFAQTESRLFSRAIIAAITAGREEIVREWPDIGTDPMKGDRSDRYQASAAACRAAYVHQQPHVPDQTALVWRWHLGALLEEHLRLNAILSRTSVPDTDEVGA